MPPDVKLCRKCGDPFVTSSTGYTVNCPSCRTTHRAPNNAIRAVDQRAYRIGYKDGKAGERKRSVSGAYSLGYKDAQSGHAMRSM